MKGLGTKKDMTNPQRASVNQRLYFCRLHLDMLQNELKSEQIPKHILEQSLGESILLHLVLTYRAYLREICYAYTSRTGQFNNVHSLEVFISAQGQRSAEVEELLNLENGSSWLSKLLWEFENLESEESAVAKPSKVNLISIRVEDEADQLLSFDALHATYQHLATIIENQRSTMEEW